MTNPSLSLALMRLEKQPYKFKNYRHAMGASALFPGCAFPSFFPHTCDALVAALAAHGVGVVFDCCGKPVEDMGISEGATSAVRGIDRRLREKGVREIVAVCPNCYAFLKEESALSVVTVYEKLAELSVGSTVCGQASLHIPCPAHTHPEWNASLEPFLGDEVSLLDAGCCGLANLGSVYRPEAVAKLSANIARKAHGHLLVSCASCAGAIARNSSDPVQHLLSEILGVKEVPDTKHSLMNRATRAFW